MAKGFGVSPITNRIYYGTQNPEKHMFTGKKEDVTDGAIAAVHEWFMGNMEGHEEYSITFPSTEFELVMRSKKPKKESIHIKFECIGCVYENIDDTSDTISQCVSCSRINDCAKNDYYMMR